MLLRRTRIQLTVFAVLTVLTLSVTSLYYARLPRVFGIGQFTVSADFADASGLYPHALVSYRGVEVGQVDALDLTERGVTVRMRVDNGTRIPSDAKAEIHSTSAIGEQFVDLVPQRKSGPFLRSGMTIPRAATVEMPQSSALIDSVDGLLQSIPKTKLSAALDEINTAVGGQGANLRRLLDDSTLLMHSAADNLSPTVSLINQLRPVLSTQQQLADQTTRYVGNLASFTDQLTKSNSDVVSLMRTGTNFAQQFSGFVADNNRTLPILIDNFTSVGQVLETYLPGLRQILVVYPALMDATPEALLPNQSDGGVKIYFKLNVNNPPPCITGFTPVSQRRDNSAVTPIPTPAGMYCKVAHSDPRAVRGARNLPCLNNPGVRAASPAECLGGSAAASKPVVAAAPYEPTTGRFLAPDGQFYLLGNPSLPIAGAGDWRTLLLNPLGLSVGGSNAGK